MRLGGFACRRLLTLNRFVHWLHDLLDLPYWSLAQHVKARFPGAQGYIERYQNATLAAARAAQVDGVVCGHIHRAAFTEVDGLLYCNDGDWVESCTALVEDQRGELSLLEWRPTAATIAAAAVSISAWAETITTAPTPSRKPPNARDRSLVPADADALRDRTARRIVAERKRYRQPNTESSVARARRASKVIRRRRQVSAQPRSPQRQARHGYPPDEVTAPRTNAEHDRRVATGQRLRERRPLELARYERTPRREQPWRCFDGVETSAKRRRRTEARS